MSAQYKTKHGAHDQSLDRKKLKHLALYIARRCEDDPRFGSIKLNKILFYSDFINYLNHGRSITGAAYKRLEYGPCPSGFHKMQEKMDEKDELKIQKRLYHGKTQKRPIALIEPDISLFTGEEIDTVNYVIQELWGKNGTQVSDMSHEFLGWQLAETYESIPYSIARVTTRKELTPFHYQLMEDTAKRILARREASGNV